MCSTHHDPLFHRDASQSINSGHPEAWASLPSPFHLGPLDQLGSAATSISVVYIYEGSPQIPLPIQFAKLRTALQYLLNSYPHLTGKLHLDEANNRRTLHRFGSSVTLIEAKCCRTLSSFTLPRIRQPQICLSDFPDGGNELLAPWQSDAKAICEGPLLSIQHTRFGCGAVALGVRVSHVVTDAAGLFQLCERLAAIYRSIDVHGDDGIVNLHPAVATSYLAGVDVSMTEDEIHAARVFVLETFQYTIPVPGPAYTAQNATSTNIPLSTIGRYVHFSADYLQAIKAAAKTHDDPNGWITTSMR
jgi:hypothetical protein